jgi:hypothetical protein
MTKSEASGIPIQGGVITVEPSVTKVRFWLRGALEFVTGGTYGLNVWSKGAPMHIVIRNADRTEELHREGPYAGSDRTAALTTIRREIDRDGLGEFLRRWDSHH